MKTIRILVFILISIPLFYSCSKTDVGLPDPGNNGGGTTGISYNVDKGIALQLINNVRQTGCNCGSEAMPPVAPITWNDQLALAAYNHSKDMRDNNYFSHTGLNGSTPGDRIRNAGYNWRTYGENIANGYPNEQAVINGWLNSPGHCRNIMNGSFKEMGMGREGSYWTQDLGDR